MKANILLLIREGNSFFKNYCDSSWVGNELLQLNNQKPRTPTFPHASNPQRHAVEVEFEYKTTTQSSLQATETL